MLSIFCLLSSGSICLKTVPDFVTYYWVMTVHLDFKHLSNFYISPFPLQQTGHITGEFPLAVWSSKLKKKVWLNLQTGIIWTEGPHLVTPCSYFQKTIKLDNILTVLQPKFQQHSLVNAVPMEWPLSTLWERQIHFDESECDWQFGQHTGEISFWLMNDCTSIGAFMWCQKVGVSASLCSCALRSLSGNNMVKMKKSLIIV